jgi:uncharacterized membrane protein
MNGLYTMDTIKAYLIALAVFLAIDMVWLLVLSKKLYSEKLGYLMTKNPNLVAAFIFYMIFIAGLLFFVIQPALNQNSWQFALFAGMFFGLVTYATYDLTNLATIKDWPLVITVIDLIWGSFVSGSTAIISYLLISRMIK